MRRGWLIVLLIAVWPAVASAQRRPPPPPPDDPAPVVAPKPDPIWDVGCGAMVYLTSRVWRECCVLCAMGSDSMSAEEKAEMVEKGEDILVIKQFFSVTGTGQYEVEEGDGEGSEAGEQAAPDQAEPAQTVVVERGGATPATRKKKKKKRTKSGGFRGLTGLSSPRIGGFDSE